MNKADLERQQLQRLLWGFALAVWLWRAIQGLLLHQLYGAPFIFVGADNVFWLYQALQIPTLVVQHYGLALGADLAWLLVTLYGCWKPQQRWAAVLLCLLYLNYFLIYNIVATHHEHLLVGGLFSLCLLLIKDLQRFVYLWAGLRYYALWVLFSAALWKFGLGSWNEPHQMTEILKMQHLDYLLARPDTTYAKGIYWLIRHSALTQWLWYLAWLLELSFAIGFFTRRWDRVLGVLWLLFFGLDYMLLSLCFAEFCILALVFYPWREIWKYYDAH